MRNPKRRRGFVLAGLGMILVSGLTVGGWFGWGPGHKQGRDLSVATAAVRRTDVQLVLTAGGTVDSVQRTLIECEVEMAGGSTILDLVPEGSDVKQGDVLCELDASYFEEQVYQQQLKVEEARADYRAAELHLQTKMSSLEEFEKGTKGQSIQELQGSVILAESNLESAVDRLKWSQQMFGFGYLAPSRLSAEQLARLKAQQSLRDAKRNLESFETYSVPMSALTLQGNVDTARAQLVYQTLRLERHLATLKGLKRQVELCKIRAPHDGFLIYANEDDDDTRVQLGSVVKNRQDMFYLPDLDRMRVQALIHETQLEAVHPGQPVRVRIEAIAAHVLEGRVLSIDPLPYRNKDWKASPDVRYFLAKIDLLTQVPGIKPGMSAGVEILAGERSGALVIPVEALIYEDGAEVVYVAGAEGIERRMVTIKPANSELVCIEQGVEEGEEVVLDPSKVADLLPSHDDDNEATAVTH